VASEKLHELENVAAVGLDGLGREVAFGTEMPQPSLDLGCDLGGDELVGLFITFP
jgi:hypothetical protein